MHVWRGRIGRRATAVRSACHDTTRRPIPDIYGGVSPDVGCVAARGVSAAHRHLNVGRAASIFIFAVVMSLIVTYSRSLWASIIAHSANDCLSFVIFGV